MLCSETLVGVSGSWIWSPRFVVLGQDALVPRIGCVWPYTAYVDKDSEWKWTDDPICQFKALQSVNVTHLEFYVHVYFFFPRSKYNKFMEFLPTEVNYSWDYFTPNSPWRVVTGSPVCEIWTLRRCIHCRIPRTRSWTLWPGAFIWTMCNRHSRNACWSHRGLGTAMHSGT